MSAVERGLLANQAQTERPAMLIRTGGGNAPSLMALRVLDRINTNRVSKGLVPVFGVFPVSSDRQIRMLNNEATDPTHILVDTQYAAIVDPYISTHGRFNDHINTVVNKSVKTKRALMQRFGPNSEPFDAMSLGLGESVTINPGDIVGVLDAGSRYPSTDHPEHEFFFPVLASKLWQGLRNEQLSYDPLLRVDDSSLKIAIEKMKEVERGYSRVWLSLINSFSYRSLPEGVTDIDEQFEALKKQPKTHLKKPILYTPPMSPNTNDEMPTDDVEQSSIFVMFSGTGSSIAETNQLIPQIIAAGYDVIVPESAIRFGDVTEENMPLVKIANSPSVIFHPNVHGVVARPGFGTVWDDENAGIETMRPPHTPGDDFEMVVNARTLDSLGLGQELRPGEVVTAEDFRRKRVEVYHRAQALKERQIAMFRTKDGLRVVADGIARRMARTEENAVTLTAREQTKLREWKIFPDPDFQGHNMTFRGRYAHIDSKIFEILEDRDNREIDFQQMNRHLDIQVLDFGAGVLEFGATTAHDFIDAASERKGKHTVHIDAVDLNSPESPSYPEVTYHSTLDGIGEGYDVIRMLHVDGMREEDYEETKRMLISKLNEGGLFIETRRLGIKSADDGDIIICPASIISISEKDTALTDAHPNYDDGYGLHQIGLYPDGKYPKSQDELPDFKRGPDKEGARFASNFLSANGRVNVREGTYSCILVR